MWAVPRVLQRVFCKILLLYCSIGIQCMSSMWFENGEHFIKQADGESRERSVHIGSTIEEAVNKRDSRGSALYVARAPEKQGNSMKYGIDVAIQVDRS